MALGFLAWAGKEALGLVGRALSGKKKDKKKKAQSFIRGGEEQSYVSSSATSSEKFVGGSTIVASPSVTFKSGTQQRGGGRIDFQALSIQLENIRNATDGLVSITEVDYRLKKKNKRDRRRFKNQSEKKKREGKLEGGASWAKKLIPSGIVKGADDIFGRFLTFIGNIGMGAFLLWLVDNIDQLEKLFSGITLGNFKLMFRGLQGSLKSIGWVGKAALKGSWNLVKKGLGAIGSGLKRIGSSIGRGFKTLGNSIFKFGLRRLRQLRGIIRGGAASARLAQGLDATRGRNTRVVSDSLSRARVASAASSFVKGSQSISGSRNLKGVAPTLNIGRDITTSGGGVVRQGRILSATAARAPSIPKSISAASKTKGGLNLLRGFKGGRFSIPWIGGLITAIISVLEGNPPAQTAWKTGGALLGGAIGGMLGSVGGPAAFFGLVVGEIIGEYLGDIFYHLIGGGDGLEGVKSKLAGTWDSIMGATSMIGEKAIAFWNWIKEGTSNLIKMMPTVKLPGILGGGEFPDFFKIFGNLGRWIASAFFGQPKPTEGTSPLDKITSEEADKLPGASFYKEYDKWLEDNNLSDDQESINKYLKYRIGIGRPVSITEMNLIRNQQQMRKSQGIINDGASKSKSINPIPIKDTEGRLINPSGLDLASNRNLDGENLADASIDSNINDLLANHPGFIQMGSPNDNFKWPAAFPVGSALNIFAMQPGMAEDFIRVLEAAT